MKYIFVIIIIVIAFYIKVSSSRKKAKKLIKKNGGLRHMYGILIDGLLRYDSARIIEDETDIIVITGTFSDPILNRTCGVWSIRIQWLPNLLSVFYQAHHDLEKGEKTKKIWDFPPNILQQEMLEKIKNKVDEWEIYGIYK